MKQLIKRLFTDSAAFAIATMGNKLVSAMLVPFYIKYLNDQQFADWGQTNTYTLILTYLCILGTDTAMAFYYFDAKSDIERKTYLTNAVVFSATMCLLFTIFAYFFGPTLADVVYDNGGGYTYLLAVAFLATVGAIIIQHLLAYARYSQRVWLFNSFSMAYVIGSNLISLYFVIVYKAGVMGIFYGQLVGQMTVAAILLIIFRKELILKFSRKHLSDLIKYGAPLLPTLMAFWAMNSISRPMLYHMSSVNDAAIYEAMMRLASIIVLITSPFQLAWRPFSMSIKEREDAPQLYGLVGRLLLVVGTIAVMMLAFFMEPIYRLFTLGEEGLASGYLYVWSLSLGTLFNVLHTVFGVGLLIKKKTKIISHGFMIAAVVYVIGCYLLIPVFRIWGAVSMTVVAYLIVIIWVYVHNQKVYPVDFRFRAMLIYLAVFLVAMVGVTWVQIEQLPNAWLYYLIALGITVAAVFMTRLFSINSIQQIGRLLPKLGGKG